MRGVAAPGVTVDVCGGWEEERLGGGLFPTVSFATSSMKMDGDGN